MWQRALLPRPADLLQGPQRKLGLLPLPPGQCCPAVGGQGAARQLRGHSPPLPLQGTCCPDLRHCCPSGYRCSTKGTKCVRRKSLRWDIFPRIHTARQML